MEVSAVCGVEEVKKAQAELARKIPFVPRVAVVLGSGLGSFADAIEEPVVVPYEEIPFWPRSTAPGHAGRIVAGRLKGVPLVAMQGRVHLYEGYSPQEVVFPVRVCAAMGVKIYLATNAS